MGRTAIPSQSRDRNTQTNMSTFFPTNAPDRLNNTLWLKAKEVSALLNIRVPTVYSHAANGLLPCIRIGGRLRFDRDRILSLAGRSSLAVETHPDRIYPPVASTKLPEMAAKRFALFTGHTNFYLGLAHMTTWLEACAALSLQPLLVDPQSRLFSEINRDNVKLVFSRAKDLSCLKAQGSTSSESIALIPQCESAWLVVILESSSDISYLEDIPSGWCCIIGFQTDPQSTVALIESVLKSVNCPT
ncbi:MAG: Helix-turn-helix domain [Verrucomicrobiota bacterium]|jgi:excisionase family DNA binding protein